MTVHPTIPRGTMKMTTARRKWDAVREAALSGDPEAMERAVSVFQPIVKTFFMDRETRAAIVARAGE